MRTRIWAELTQAKHNIEFTELYSDLQRTVLRLFNIGILIFSTGGVMGWKVWDKIPVVACLIIATISSLRLIQPHLIMNDKLLNNLDRIQKFYIDYYNRLERLWYDFDASRIDDTQATTRFYEIRDTETEIKTIIGETLRNYPKKLEKKAKEHSDNFFKQAFNT